MRTGGDRKNREDKRCLETGSDRTGLSGCDVPARGIVLMLKHADEQMQVPKWCTCFLTGGTGEVLLGEQIEQILAEKPYGFIEDPCGDSGLCDMVLFTSPWFQPEQIGDFENYFRSRYYDSVMYSVQTAIENEQISVNRYPRNVPDYENICAINPQLRFIRIYEACDSVTEIKDENLRATVLVDAVVAVDLLFSKKNGDIFTSESIGQWFRCRTAVNLLTGQSSRSEVKVYYPTDTPPGRRLSDQLYPLMSEDELDHEAHRILEAYCPEAIENPRALKGEELAARLGLTIRYELLGNSGENQGRLFLREQDVQVPGWNGNLKNIHVEANTILIAQEIRQDEKKREDAIIHECIHFLEHPRFFYFQWVHEEEMAAFSNGEPMPVYHLEKTPVDKMERQANTLTARVRMPYAYSQKIVVESLRWNRDVGVLLAYNRAIRRLAAYCNVSVPTAKIRMKEMGYKDTPGVLNRCDHGYARDYAGGEDDYHRYVIKAEQLEIEYERNPALRELAQSGAVLYVGGYLVRNRPESVVWKNGKYVLTEEALNHVAEHCIGFVVIRDGGHYQYDPDSFHKDHTRHPEDICMDKHQNLETLMELDADYDSLSEENASSFGELLKRYMKLTNMTVEELVEDTGIGEATIKNYRSGKTSPSLEFVISICVALGLSSTMAWNLVKAAHFTFKPSDGQPYKAYCFILDYLTVDYSVEEVNDYLQRKDQLPLSFPHTK